jgi:hypothetical protein
MNNWIDRVLKAYRPLYMRGLLMDGQYRLPQTPKKPPVAGKRKIHLFPAFGPARRHVLVTTATAAVVGVCANAALSASSESTAEPAPDAAIRLDRKV